DGTAIPGHRFVIATGSRSAVPEIPGLAEAGFLDNTQLWSLGRLPESLIVIGAGPSGIEFAQCFARFGSRVTILADSPQVLTHAARVYAIGDVLMRQQYTHATEREAAVAFQNAVLRLRKRMDYDTLPWATFSDPEVAGVGITEAQARAEHREIRVYRVPFAEI